MRPSPPLPGCRGTRPDRCSPNPGRRRPSRWRCSLSDAGYFTWTEWAETLGAELRAAGEDDGSRYYETWLRALERLSLSKGLTDAAALDQRTAAWADAYRRTPHGQPVELRGT